MNKFSFRTSSKWKIQCCLLRMTILLISNAFYFSTKNVKFEVNFGKNLAGADTEPWFAPEEGYKFVGTEEAKQRGSPRLAYLFSTSLYFYQLFWDQQFLIALTTICRIATRAECEIIMLVGLPGAGKTTWATKYVEEKAEKNYNLIGASSIYERMKVRLSKGFENIFWISMVFFRLISRFIDS